MGFWDTAGRIGLGIGTMGGSELVRNSPGARDLLLGGLGRSSNPNDYSVPGPYAGLALGAITPGLGTNRPAPQTGMDSPFRTSQLQQMGQLQGIASGQNKGAGELAVQRQAQLAAGQQQGMARMARGGGAGLAAMNAANNTAGIGLSAAGMGQQAAMQDQMNAQGLLANVTGQGRSADQQVMLANLDAKLRQMGMDDATRLGYLQQLTGLNAQAIGGQQGAMQTALGQQGLLGPLLSAGAQVGGAALTGK